MENNDCINPERRKNARCLAMPKDQIELKLETILEKITVISDDVKDVKKTLQDQSLRVMSVEKEIEFIKKERTEDKAENEKERTEDKTAHEKDIEIIHKSMHRRDKKQMWFTGIMVGIGGILATIASIFFGK